MADCRGMDSGSIPWIAIQIAILLFAVSVHESAHGLAAFAFGDRTAHDLGRISLNPLKHADPMGTFVLPALLAFSGAPIFGWAKPVPVSLAGVANWRLANLVVSAAGPLSNLLLAWISTVVLGLLGGETALAATGLIRWAALAALLSLGVNVTLAVFNLIPIPPLDGFGVVESLLPAPALRALQGARRWAFPLLVVLMLSGTLTRILVPMRRVVMGLFLHLIA